MCKDFAEIIKGATRVKTSSLNGWYWITPSVAIEFLKKNIKNFRNVNKNIVNSYASDMAAGEWKANGETIVFSTDGILRNGQHRLNAIIESGTAVLCYVVFDAPQTEFYDNGYKRSNVQILRAQGVAATNLMVGIARFIVAGGATAGKSSNAVVNKYVETNFDYLAKAQKVICTKGGAPGRKAACGAIAYCLMRNSDIPEAEIADFFKVVNSGNSAGVEKDPSSALVIRNQLMKMQGGGQANQAKQLEYTIKAIEDFHSDITRKRNYTNDTHNAERLIKQVQDLDKLNFQVVA